MSTTTLSPSLKNVRHVLGSPPLTTPTGFDLGSALNFVSYSAIIFAFIGVKNDAIVSLYLNPCC